jgi:hypothetical protein
MQAYDERIEASKRFVYRNWYASDREWRRTPIAGHWATIKPLGGKTFEIIVERDDELHCRTLLRRKRRCETLLEAKEFAWRCLEPRLESALNRPRPLRWLRRN